MLFCAVADALFVAVRLQNTSAKSCGKFFPFLGEICGKATPPVENRKKKEKHPVLCLWIGLCGFFFGDWLKFSFLCLKEELGLDSSKKKIKKNSLRREWTKKKPTTTTKGNNREKRVFRSLSSVEEEEEAVEGKSAHRLSGPRRQEEQQQEGVSV